MRYLYKKNLYDESLIKKYLVSFLAFVGSASNFVQYNSFNLRFYFHIVTSHFTITVGGTNVNKKTKAYRTQREWNMKTER